jgi:hypothetical protein
MALDDAACLDLWQRLPPDPLDAELQRNIPITQPILWLNR